jgi:hypothetical protein
MLKSIVPILIVVLLWYITFDCNKGLSQSLSKQAILIFTFVSYFAIMLIYTYYNIDHCYNHLSVLNTELIILLLLVATTTLTSNLVFMHTEMPKII